MRFQSLIGLQNKPSSVGSLQSGVQYSTAPTDSQLGAVARENNKSGQNYDNIYELVRISGTCTVGALLYPTGTANAWVVCTGTGAGKPYGISLVAPTASGVWTWAQKYGINTTIQITGTVGGSAAGSSMLVAGGSAAGNVSQFYSGIASGVVGGYYPIFGRSLTEATGSTTIGLIDLL